MLRGTDEGTLCESLPPCQRHYASSTGLVFAFEQGILREVVLRLIGGTHTKADRGVYYRCPWWQAKKAEALRIFGCSCALCGSNLSLQVHHKPQGYKRLFREKTILDLTVLCRKCHKRHHWK